MKKIIKILSIFISIIVLALSLTACGENTDSSITTTASYYGNREVKSNLVGTWAYEQLGELDDVVYGSITVTIRFLEDGTFIKKSVAVWDKEEFIKAFIAEAYQSSPEHIEEQLELNDCDSVEEYAEKYYKTEIEESLLVDFNYEKKGTWIADDSFIYMHYEGDETETLESYVYTDATLKIGNYSYQKNLFK